MFHLGGLAGILSKLGPETSEKLALCVDDFISVNGMVVNYVRTVLVVLGIPGSGVKIWIRCRLVIVARWLAVRVVGRPGRGVVALVG